VPGYETEGVVHSASYLMGFNMLSSSGHLKSRNAFAEYPKQAALGTFHGQPSGTFPLTLDTRCASNRNLLKTRFGLDLPGRISIEPGPGSPVLLAPEKLK